MIKNKNIVQLEQVEFWLVEQLGLLVDVPEGTLIVSAEFDDMVDEAKHDHVVQLGNLINQYLNGTLSGCSEGCEDCEDCKEAS